jgi:hypothetical protein
MRTRTSIRTRAYVALLWLLLALHLASRCAAAAWHKQQVALQPTLATWNEAFERCAGLGRRLAPRELAARAAADVFLLDPATTHQCTPHGSDATVVWVDVGDSSRAPPGPGEPGRAVVDQCQGLAFNLTSRQARPTRAACDQRHCFLCSAEQAEQRESATGSAESGRRLTVAVSSNCNMTGQQPDLAACAVWAADYAY